MSGISPAFQFYPAKWLGSTTIMTMTPEQEGAFIRLLCHQWESPSCMIPSEERILANLSRLGKRWKRLGALILTQFIPVEGSPGFIRNPRLYKEFEKQTSFKNKCKWAAVRQHLKGGDPQGNPPGYPEGAQRVPTKNPEGTQVGQTHPHGGTPVYPPGDSLGEDVTHTPTSSCADTQPPTSQAFAEAKNPERTTPSRREVRRRRVETIIGFIKGKT